VRLRRYVGSARQRRNHCGARRPLTTVMVVLSAPTSRFRLVPVQAIDGPLWRDAAGNHGPGGC